VYRYLNNIKDIPRLNGKQLVFRTYSLGYNYEKIAKQLKNTTNTKKILKCLINHDSSFKHNHCTKILKLYFPEIIEELNSIYSTELSLSERVFLYINDMTNPPLCNFCKQKRCRWTNAYTTGYGNFCGKSCQSKFYSIERFLKGDEIKLDEWKKYCKTCRRYTNYISQ